MLICTKLNVATSGLQLCTPAEMPVFFLVGFILSPHIYTYTEVGNNTPPPHPMAPPVLKVIIYFSIVLSILILYLF